MNHSGALGPCEIFQIRCFGHAQRPGTAGLRVIVRLLDLVFIRITINMQNLSGIDQIGVFDFGPVSFEEQRPLVGVTVNFLLGRNTPEVVTDLPAGAKRFKQTATGILATIVNGEVLLRSSVPTGNTPGKLIRGPLAG